MRLLLSYPLWVAAATDCSSCDFQSISCGNPASARPVCDALGLIQTDDILCDGADCACTDGFVCASLRLGCPGVIQGGSRARCLSLAGLRTRYDAYRDAVVPPGPSTYPVANLSWVHYHHNHNDCAWSDDCSAMQQFHACDAVLCGSAVVMWSEVHGDDDREYRFVVEGTLADRSAGVFAMAARWKPASRRLSCDSIVTTRIDKRYTRQTRADPDHCVDRYMELSAPVTFAAAVLESARRTSWEIWVAVVSAIGTVIAAVGGVVYVWRINYLPEKVTSIPEPMSAIVTANQSAMS